MSSLLRIGKYLLTNYSLFVPFPFGEIFIWSQKAIESVIKPALPGKTGNLPEQDRIKQ